MKYIAQQSQQVQEPQQKQEVQQQIQTKVDQYVSSPEFFSWVSAKITPWVSGQVQQFLNAHQTELVEYAANPDKLFSDFEQYFKILDYVDVILNIIDIVSIVSIVIEVIGAFFTEGASLALIGGTFTLRQMIKLALRKEGRDILRRVVIRIGPQLIKRMAVKGVAKFSIAFAKEFTFRIGVYIFFRSLVSMVQGGEAIALTAAKQYVKDKAAPYGISGSLIDSLVAPDVSSQTFVNIANKQITDTTTYIKGLLTANGLASLSLGAVARMLHINLRAKFLMHNQAIARYMKKPNELLKPSTPQDEAEQTKITQQLPDTLHNSHIPKSLQPKYQEELTKIIEHTGKDADKAVKQQIQSAESQVVTIEETLKELAVLEFIEKFASTLADGKHDEQLNNLLDSATNIETSTVSSLMDQTNTKNISDLLEALKKRKQYNLSGLLNRLALGHSTPELAQATKQELSKTIDLSGFEKHLYDVTFVREKPRANQIPQTQSAS